jgi:hypothetical protein
MKPRDTAGNETATNYTELFGVKSTLADDTSDHLDPKQVSDEAIKHITSALTVVDGKVVHNSRKAGR